MGRGVAEPGKTIPYYAKFAYPHTPRARRSEFAKLQEQSSAKLGISVIGLG